MMMNHPSPGCILNYRPLSVFYYVHRTSVIKECYEFLSSLDEPMLVSETVLNSFVAEW